MDLHNTDGPNKTDADLGAQDALFTELLKKYKQDFGEEALNTLFRKISTPSVDSQEAIEKVEELETDPILISALDAINKEYRNLDEERRGLTFALNRLLSIEDHKNARKYIKQVQLRIDEIKDIQTQRKKKKNRIVMGLLLMLAIVIIGIPVTKFFVIPELHYAEAKQFFNDGEYDIAYHRYLALDSYKDSDTMANECLYQEAIVLKEQGEYSKANGIFQKLGNYKDSKKLIHVHSYELKEKTAPTCVKNGVNVYYCSGCSEHYDSVVYATGLHNYLITDKVDASCQNVGKVVYTCSMCNASYSNVTPKLNHMFKQAEKTAATCKADGRIVDKCSVCGESIVTVLNKLTTHTYVISQKSTATCEADGVTINTCSICGKTEKVSTKALGHSWGKATCTSASTCSRCGKKQGGALGHTTESAFCTRCGVLLYEKVEYSGTGSTVLSNINFPKGKFRFTCTMVSGDTNIHMYFNHGASAGPYSYDDLILNHYEAGSSDVTVIDGPIKSGAITVNAPASYRGISTSWKIVIEAIG